MKFDKYLRIKPSYCNDSLEDVEILPNGSGVTDFVQAYLTRVDLDFELADVNLLMDLKSFFAGKYMFERIKVQYSIKDNTSLPLWEIYLVETGHYQKALSEYPSDVHLVIAESVVRHLYRG